MASFEVTRRTLLGAIAGGLAASSSLTARADQAMYQAKWAGKNKIHLAKTG